MKLKSLNACLMASAFAAFAAVSAAAAADNVPPELADAFAGKFKGTKVTAFGPFTAGDEVRFNDTIKAFEEATGIDIQYEGSKQFEATIATRSDAGNPPDIADFPQPGLLANFAKAGKLVDLSGNKDYFLQQYIPGWVDMATKEGQDGTRGIYGVWERVNVKSLVWYPKKAFDAAGYKVPTTWAELEALQDQIVADGDTPWCVGIESGAATGWPATDWLEEFMLRTTSLENYDAWTEGKLPFSSPEVKKAAETLGKIWLDEKYVYGGRKGIVSTSFGDSPVNMFSDPPKCWLHKQGNFITAFFPEKAKAGVDYSFFYLPGIDEAYGKPVLVGGDIWGAFNDRPEVKAVMQYFAKAEHLKAWLAVGGAIAPQKDADLAWYQNEVDKGVAAILAGATAVRFDGSDLMPGEVGAGSFWKQMTAWVSGTADLDTALKDIDASWPKK